jgi:hypothetical protein
VEKKIRKPSDNTFDNTTQNTALYLPVMYLTLDNHKSSLLSCIRTQVIVDLIFSLGTPGILVNQI